MENATITICGNTGVDGELRYGANSGKPFLNIPVAVSYTHLTLPTKA